MNGNVNVQTGEKNVIESISVNGKKIDPNNKNVDILVPENHDTTYTLKQSGNTLTLTGSDGSESVVTVSDTNTTYSLEKQGNQIILTGSDGKKTSVEATNTTYSLEKLGSTITLKGSNGSSSSVSEKTYSEASEDQPGFMSKEDKAKLNSIPFGGMNAYSGDFYFSNGVSPLKINTSSKPKFMILSGGGNREVERLLFFTDSGSYYMSGSDYAGIVFEEDGVTISWPTGATLVPVHRYLVVC